jgi:hypothetical protein
MMLMGNAPIRNEQRVVRDAHSAMCDAQCTIYNARCAMLSPRFVIYNVRCTMQDLLIC